MDEFLIVSDGPREGHNSYVGGKPQLPDRFPVPSCGLCGAQQAFFFQLRIPEGLPRHGETMVVFQCVSCAREEGLIPEMLGGPLKGAVVPRAFITAYQRNFRILFFPNDEIVTCDQYRELVVFKELRRSARKARGLFGKLAGTPEWLMEDEAPKRLDTGEPLEFLMQLKADFHFSIGPDAPHAVEMGLFGEEVSSENYYRLFISNELYIFVNAVGEPFPYLLTQCA